MYRNDGERDFSAEEHGDDDDEHESGTVGVSEALALALSVLLEQFVTLELGVPQSTEQQDVEHHEADAGHQVHEDHTKPEVHCEVHVQRQPVLYPVGKPFL